jgi:hypothetical protein
MQPVAMAASGMPGWAAAAGSSAMQVPPAALTACTPSRPSKPVPLRTMARVRFP